MSHISEIAQAKSFSLSILISAISLFLIVAFLVFGLECPNNSQLSSFHTITSLNSLKCQWSILVKFVSKLKSSFPSTHQIINGCQIYNPPSSKSTNDTFQALNSIGIFQSIFLNVLDLALYLKTLCIFPESKANFLSSKFQELSRVYHNLSNLSFRFSIKL
ncbi:TPA: hypothetical protein DEG21_06155 [Patescibacteria group bacterium]|nr:hypothetical protein [Candidatus Gracilibacteria bacterium]